MPLLDVKGRAFYYTHGEVDPLQAPEGEVAVVALHGAGAQHGVWAHYLYALGKKVPFLALDLPGHGRSQTLDGEVSCPSYARSVADLWETLLEKRGEKGRLRLVLMGHSMGGAVAIEYALTYQDTELRPEGLILVGTGGRLRVRPDFLETLSKGSFPPELMAAVSGRSLEEAAQADPSQSGVVEGPEVVYRDLLACDRFDRLEELGKIRVPTLVVHGDQDQMTPLKYGQRLAEDIPEARLVVVEGAGHLVHAQKPGPVTRAIREFLEELSQGR
ncbi:MAG: alpha/beta hydrolase [Clostridiales bacterium]|nr:alpha/beta hydrolase [Clostridiales bacterium]